MASTFPFGRRSTRRDPRRPNGNAGLLVLGVYPSALHVRWRRPDGETVGALAVDDEPEVFWDGADAADRIAAWRETSTWRNEYGTVSLAGGNGSSGRIVRDGVLTPLGVKPANTYFTDCLPFYFTKSGSGSQGQRIAEVYQGFAAERGLPKAGLPTRPTAATLVSRTLANESGALLAQLAEAAADRIVTLGQEAADVFAALVETDRVKLRTDDTYGTSRSVRVARQNAQWIPLTHPGNRHARWQARHAMWVQAQS